MTRLTATQVARNFSELLNRVGAGEEIEVTRNGAPVARLSPVRPTSIPGERFLELIDGLPRPDNGWLEEFEELRRGQGPPPDRWPSSSSTPAS